MDQMGDCAARAIAYMPCMIPLSVLDLAPVPEGSDVSAALANTLDLARNAENWGYSRYWLAEHHNMPGIASAATSVVMAHVAAGTKTIRVGAGGVMLPNHAPLVIAEQFGTLAALHPGRIDLGLGRAPGTDLPAARALRRNLDNEANGFPRDVMELIRYFGPVEPGQQVQAVPGAGLDVPVWILGSSLYGASLAAAFGLPYAFASHFAPAELEGARDLYRARFQPGPWGEAPRFMLAVNLVCAPTDEEAAFLRSSAQLSFARLRTGRPGLLPPPVANVGAEVPAAVLRQVDQALGVAAIGSPETVTAEIARLTERHHPDEIILTGNIWDPRKRRESFRLAAAALGLRAAEPA